MLAYCDYIAHVIGKELRADTYKEDTFIHYVDKVKMDLHPEEGYFVSTKKTIKVQDKNDKWYKVTVEEL